MDPKENSRPHHPWNWTDPDLYKKLMSTRPGTDFNNELYRCLINSEHMYSNPSGFQPTSQRYQSEYMQRMLNPERADYLNSKTAKCMSSNNNRYYSGNGTAMNNKFLDHRNTNNNPKNKEPTVQNIYNYFNVNSPHMYNMMLNGAFNPSLPEKGYCQPAFPRKDNGSCYGRVSYEETSSLLNNITAALEAYTENQCVTSKTPPEKRSNKWYKLPELLPEHTASSPVSSNDLPSSMNVRHSTSPDNIHLSNVYRQSPVQSATASVSQNELQTFNMFNLIPAIPNGHSQNSISMTQRSPGSQCFSVPPPSTDNDCASMSGCLQETTVNNNEFSQLHSFAEHMDGKYIQEGRHDKTVFVGNTAPSSEKHNYPQSPSRRLLHSLFLKRALTERLNSPAHKTHVSDNDIGRMTVNSVSNPRHCTRDIDVLNPMAVTTADSRLRIGHGDRDRVNGIDETVSSKNQTNKRKSDEAFYSSPMSNAKRRTPESSIPDDVHIMQNQSVSYNSSAHNETQSEQMNTPFRYQLKVPQYFQDKQSDIAKTIEERTITHNSVVNNNMSELLRTKLPHNCNGINMERGQSHLHHEIQRPLKDNSNIAKAKSCVGEKSPFVLSSERRKRKNPPKHRPSPITSVGDENRMHSEKNYSRTCDFGLKLPVSVKPTEQNLSHNTTEVTSEDSVQNESVCRQVSGNLSTDRLVVNSSDESQTLKMQNVELQQCRNIMNDSVSIRPTPSSRDENNSSFKSKQNSCLNVSRMESQKCGLKHSMNSEEACMVLDRDSFLRHEQHPVQVQKNSLILNDENICAADSSRKTDNEREIASVENYIHTDCGTSNKASYVAVVGGLSNNPSNDIVEEGLVNNPCRDVIEDGLSKQLYDDTLKGGSSNKPLNDTLKGGSSNKPSDQIKRCGSSNIPLNGSSYTPSCETLIVGSSNKPSNDITEGGSSNKPSNDITETGSSNKPSNDITETGSSNKLSNDITETGSSNKPSNDITEGGSSNKPSNDIMEARSSNTTSCETLNIGSLNKLSCDTMKDGTANKPSCDTLECGSTEFNNYTLRFIFMNDIKYFLLDDIEFAFSQTLIDSALSYSSTDVLRTCDENMALCLSKLDPKFPSPKAGSSKLISEDIYNNIITLSMFVKEVYASYKKEQTTPSKPPKASDKGNGITDANDTVNNTINSSVTEDISAKNDTTVKSESNLKSDIQKTENITSGDEANRDGLEEMSVSDGALTVIYIDDDDDDSDSDDSDGEILKNSLYPESHHCVSHVSDETSNGSIRRCIDEDSSEAVVDPVFSSVAKQKDTLPVPQQSTKQVRGKKTSGIKQKKKSQAAPAKTSSKSRTSKRRRGVKFVGRAISHEWIVNEKTGEKQTYIGFVTGVVEGKDGYAGTVYEVSYEGEECSYEVGDLLDDLEEGTLKFVDVSKIPLKADDKDDLSTADINKENIETVDKATEDKVTPSESKSEESDDAMLEAFHLIDSKSQKENRDKQNRDVLKKPSTSSGSRSQPDSAKNSDVQESDKRYKNIAFFNKQLRVVLTDCLNKKLIQTRKSPAGGQENCTESSESPGVTTDCNNLVTPADSSVHSQAKKSPVDISQNLLLQ